MNTQGTAATPAPDAAIWLQREIRTRDGVAIATFEAGRRDDRAPVLLLVHGVGHWATAAWTPLASAFLKTHRIVAFDLPGFGSSERPRVAYDLRFFSRTLGDVVKATEVERATLAGHSIGGTIAAYYASEHPQAVDALALLDPAGFLRTPGVMARVLLSGVVRPFAGRLRKPRVLTERTIDASVFDPARVSKATRDRAYLLAQDPELARAFASVYADAKHDFFHIDALRATFARWTGPTLLVWGKQDRYVPVRSLAAARRVYPHASVLEIDRCGHCPAIEYPGLVAEAIAQLTSRPS